MKASRRDERLHQTNQGRSRGKRLSSLEELKPPTAAQVAEVIRSEILPLSPLDYDRRRPEFAKRLGVRLGTLDREVKRCRREAVKDAASDAGLLASSQVRGGAETSITETDLLAEKQRQRSDPGKQSQAEELVSLALEAGIELFHSGEDAYAMVAPNETLLVKSQRFRQWLRQLFYEHHRKPPGNQGMQDAVELLASKGVIEGEEKPVYMRVAKLGDRVVVDLGRDASVVVVTASGSEITKESPVRFLRPKTSLPLPVPQRGAKIGELRRYLNLGGEDASDAHFILIVSWLVAVLSGCRLRIPANLNGHSGPT